MSVKGKRVRIDVVELLCGWPTEVVDSRMRTRDIWDGGLAAYRGGDREAAVRALDEILRVDPGDAMARAFRDDMRSADPSN